MIWIDPRVGSGELLPYFAPYDVEVEVTPLEFGDLAFVGQGHDGPLMVGIERKNLNDLIASMRSNRLSGHQLPGLCANYSVVMLIIEGIWQCGASGEIVMMSGSGWRPYRIGSGPILYREVDHYLATMEHKRGVVVKYTSSKQQTVAWVVSRYKWWQKEWVKHTSDEAIYSAYDEQQRGRRASFTRRVVGPVELVASQMPGVDRKAYEFGKRFKSVEEMVLASEKELREVEGIGKTGAKRIWRWLRNGKEG